MKIRTDLRSSQEQVQQLLSTEGHKPRMFAFANFMEFFRNMPSIAKLIVKEPEILVFVFIQLLVICLTYFAWIQMLKWIPDNVWNEIAKTSRADQKIYFTLLNLVLLGWSFLLIVVASYPISVCNAAMAVVYNLKTLGEKPSFGKCLGIATHYIGKLWAFTAIDALITVMAIMDRLPKKNGNRTALDELVYYAWKLSTITVTNSLVNGRGFVEAGKEAVSLLIKQPLRVIGIRFGYSALCWIIGISSYIGSIFYFVFFGDSSTNTTHWLYNFYAFMTPPVFVSTGIVTVLLRPFYFLSVSKLYAESADTTTETKRDLISIPNWKRFIFSFKTIIFLVLLVTILALVFFGDQIGFVGWIHALANKDFIANH